MPPADLIQQIPRNGQSTTSKSVIFFGKYDPNALDGEIMTIVGQADALHARGVNLEIWKFSRRITEIKLSHTRTGAEIWDLPLFGAKVVSAWTMPQATRRWIEQRLDRVQLFHFHSVFNPIHNQLAARFGKPYVVTPNGAWSAEVFKGRNRLAKWAWTAVSEKRYWSRANFVQAVSPGEYDRLKSLPGMAHVEEIPNGVELPDMKSFAQPRDAWVFMGRLAVDHKGLDRMVRAYALCRKRGLSLPKLLLAGPDFRGGKAALVAQIASLGLEKEIELPGPVTGREKSVLLGRASLFLHTSRWEGLPLAMLDAMAHGAPCLVTQGTNFSGVIKQSRTGYCAGESDEQIADAMAGVNGEQCREMGLRARQLVETEYTWPRIAGRLMRAYEHTCEADFAPQNEFQRD